MVSYSVSPEHGVTGYAGDATQGPACAIACGAGEFFFLLPFFVFVVFSSSSQEPFTEIIWSPLEIRLDRLDLGNWMAWQMLGNC